jgi:hypothetical protein
MERKMTITESVKHTIKLALEGTEASIGQCTTEALEEFKVFLEDREETEFAVARYHGRFPPQAWIAESRRLQRLTNGALLERKKDDEEESRYVNEEELEDMLNDREGYEDGQSCDVCNGKGWILSCSEDGNDEIQRCDDCQIFDNDEEIVKLEIVERSSGYWIVGDYGVEWDEPFIHLSQAIKKLNELKQARLTDEG